MSDWARRGDDLEAMIRALATRWADVSSASTFLLRVLDEGWDPRPNPPNLDRPPEQVSRQWHAITPQFLTTVAAVYRSALADGTPPAKAVAEHFLVNRATASRWVRQARKAHILGPSMGTVAGEAEHQH